MPLFKKPSIEEMREKGDIKGLIKALGDKSLHDSAADTLLEMGEQAIKPLIEAFHGYSAKTLSPYGAILVRIGEPAVQPLIEVLYRYRGRIRDERRQAAIALGEIGDERAIKPLCWARRKEPTMTGAGEFLIPALRKITKPPYQILLGTLEDDDKDTRLGAMDTVLDIAREQKLDVSAIGALSKALQDKETTMRQMAADALGDIYDQGVVEPLKMAHEDSSWFVRDTAKQSLKRVQDKLQLGH